VVTSELGEVAIRPLRREELETVIEWAAIEGWNPGLGDAEVFWRTDPEAHLGAERDGELIGAGSVVSYEGRFGFMGLFIVRPEYRGLGLGRRLWLHRRDRLRERLREGAAIGMDGVLEMQPFYAEGGFQLAHRDLRVLGEVSGADDPALRPLAELPFAEVSECDRAHFGFPRERFLRSWIAPDGGLGLGLREGGRLRGMGVIRPARAGHKVGPLFAEDLEVADRILRGLSAAAKGPVMLDLPESNLAAIELASRHRLEQVFECGRMYLGRAPALPWERIFGITTLELG
jgi:GNAT superfamily N-acetyltransferase